MKAMPRILAPALGVFLGVTALFRCPAARAEEPPITHGPDDVVGALYTPTQKGDVLTWYARWMLAPETYDEAPARGDRGPIVIRFAVPLPEGAALASDSAPLEPIVEEGRIVGVRVLQAPLAIGESLGERTVRGKFVQPAPRPGERVALAAPIAAGPVLQIIDGIVDGGPRVDVDLGRVLERHVGWVGPRGATPETRAQAQAAARFFVPGVRGNTIFVRGDDVRALGGLTGAIATPISRSAVIAIAGAFAAIVAALLWAMRRLRHAASVERADAILSAEIEGTRA